MLSKQAKDLYDLYDKNCMSLKKLKKISEYGKILHANGLVGLTEEKWTF